jgi:hypothetical protein
MHYTERMPVVGISRQEPDNLAKRVLSYKNYRWGYEREWRMFGPLGKIYYKTQASIRHVYLGPRATEAERTKVETRLRAVGISVRSMSLEGYSMKF